MCLAIVNISGVIDRSLMRTSWELNPDGGGLLYIEKKDLVDHKQLSDFESFYDKYFEVRNKTKKPILVHFRWATHGKKNLKNCHPFFVNKNIGFIHNGIIDGVGYSNEKSDTVLFNEKVLQKLPAESWQDPGLERTLAGYIGGSKLAFLHSDGNYMIVNEKLGHWDNGNWFSNSCYKRMPPARSLMTALKEEKNKVDNYANRCFLCGTSRSSYDRVLGEYICSNCRSTYSMFNV